MVKLYPFAFLLLLTAKVSSQSKFLNGYLQDSITHFGIVGGSIVNGTTNKSVETDAKGFFRIEASSNDLIYVSAASYNNDTISYSLMFTDTITVFLSPSGNIMPNVIVTSKFTKYQLDSMRRKEDFEQALGYKIPVLSSAHPSGFGLTFNLDRVFKKKYRNQESQYQSFKISEKAAYVNYRFSPQYVATFTGLKGDALREFLYRYTPSYNWLRQHTFNEDMLYYINDKLKEYRKNPSLLPSK